ncbi:3-isopropylmalate dehydratase [bacterium]|nr:3-isopropylmalate dehydratase [bacterium]
MKDKIIKGRALHIIENGTYIDDIDTDMIFHNSFLAITEIEKMGQHAFGNLDGWKDFPSTAKKGDVLVVGKNFGAGSSRQQAVDCFTALGVTLIIGESFGAIYKRNAINAGVPLIELKDFNSKDLIGCSELKIDLEKGIIMDLQDNKVAECKPFSKVQMDIYQNGNLFEYGKKMRG